MNHHLQLADAPLLPMIPHAIMLRPVQTATWNAIA
jgi:hypothetical protein